jgi:hypothetical protein
MRFFLLRRLFGRPALTRRSYPLFRFDFAAICFLHVRLKAESTTIVHRRPLI